MSTPALSSMSLTTYTHGHGCIPPLSTRFVTCRLPRYNTTSAEKEPEWRTIYWSKAQSYIIQHCRDCVGASPKEGTRSLTDLSIITPKDTVTKFLLPNPIIITMNLRQYSTQSINATPRPTLRPYWEVKKMAFEGIILAMLYLAVIVFCLVAAGFVAVVSYIMYLRRVKYAHIPGPPFKNFWTIKLINATSCGTL